MGIIQRSLKDFGWPVTALSPEDRKNLMQLFADGPLRGGHRSPPGTLSEGPGYPFGPIADDSLDWLTARNPPYSRSFASAVSRGLSMPAWYQRPGPSRRTGSGVNLVFLYTYPFKMRFRVIVSILAASVSPSGASWKARVLGISPRIETLLAAVADPQSIRYICHDHLARGPDCNTLPRTMGECLQMGSLHII